jgi:ABC-type multidrug transport system fused ATPase/permease subunit
MNKKEDNNKEEFKKDVVENREIKEKIDENKNSKENTSKKQNRQIIYAVVLMILVILIILLTPYVMKNYINKFTYNKLDFYKTKVGEIQFYSTMIPVTDKQMNIISAYPLNLRNDPRKLDYIKDIVNGTNEVINDENDSESQIIFKKFLPVYISLQSDSPRCEDNMIAVVGLSQFLKEFGNFTVNAAMDNKTYANETGYPYVTCNNHPTNTVIHLISGNSTEVIKFNDNCYELVYSNCEITQVTEKFILEILEGYMVYFNRY